MLCLPFIVWFLQFVLLYSELPILFADYMDCVQYCYSGRCVTQEDKFVCLCNTGYTGNNCTKGSKPFLQTIYKIRPEFFFNVLYLEQLHLN